MKRFIKIFTVLLVFLLLGLIILLYLNRVDNELTSEDIEFTTRFMEGTGGLDRPLTYEKEITFIKKVQERVLSIACGNKGLPFERSREPRDLFLAKSGLCYDRSRTIEKILRASGFETRHLAVYELKGSRPPAVFFEKDLSSHAVSEVLTKRGWLVVDSNDPWISLDESGVPVSIEKIMENAEKGGFSYDSELYPFMNNIFKDPFACIYGLYSRHGKFYPPHNFIPDINWGEFRYNVCE